MKRYVMHIVIFFFVLNLAGFAYTFVQPHWTATIVKVGMPRSVKNAGMQRHGSRTHTVVPLTVTYADGDGEEQKVVVNYSRPTKTFQVGEQIEVTRSYVTGIISYPFTGLRMFCGMVAGSIGLFLFFTWLDREKKK